MAGYYCAIVMMHLCIYITSVYLYLYHFLYICIFNHFLVIMEGEPGIEHLYKSGKSPSGVPKQNLDFIGFLLSEI